MYLQRAEYLTSGAKTVCITGKIKTKLEGRAELVFHDSIGKILSVL